MALNNIKNLRSESGFTLVELLIVIVVIAILAAISIVSYTGIQNRARATSAESLASQVAKKADAYYTINSEYPTTAAEFSGTDESDLEDALVTFVTTQPSGTPESETLYTNLTAGVTGDSDWKSGQRVVYFGNAGDLGGDAGGYVVYYWGVGNVAKVITKNLTQS